MNGHLLGGGGEKGRRQSCSAFWAAITMFCLGLYGCPWVSGVRVLLIHVYLVAEAD